MKIGYPSSTTVSGQLERITTCLTRINEDNLSDVLDLRNKNIYFYKICTPEGLPLSIVPSSGIVNITGNLNISAVPIYVNNAAAVAGGLAVGGLYRTNADPDPICIVH